MSLLTWILCFSCGWITWQLVREIAKRQGAELKYESLHYDHMTAVAELRSKRIMIKRITAQRDAAQSHVIKLVKDLES